MKENGKDGKMSIICGEIFETAGRKKEYEKKNE